MDGQHQGGHQSRAKQLGVLLLGLPLGIPFCLPQLGNLFHAFHLVRVLIVRYQAVDNQYQHYAPEESQYGVEATQLLAVKLT